MNELCNNYLKALFLLPGKNLFFVGYITLVFTFIKLTKMSKFIHFDKKVQKGKQIDVVHVKFRFCDNWRA